MVWPIRFVNDELWLRSRRATLRGMADLGLRSPDEAYHDYMEAQQQRGRDILDRLQPYLGSAQFSILVSDALLGPQNARFSRRLPFILAFGHEYARCLELISGGSDDGGSEIRDLSALFNLGIVLVDNLSDEPSRFGELSEVMDATRLRLLLSGSESEGKSDTGAKFSTPELQLLDQIVSTFFRIARSIHQRSNYEYVWTDLSKTIQASYHAQVQSSRGQHTEAVSREKSVSPFLVAPLLVEMIRGPSAKYLMSLGSYVGHVFWLVDDLVDVARDYHSGQTNSVLLRAGVQNTPGQDNGLALILEESYIETAVSEIQRNIRAMMELCRKQAVPDDGLYQLTRWVEMYVLDWMQ